MICFDFHSWVASVVLECCFSFQGLVCHSR
jgi:hypothetical protein